MDHILIARRLLIAKNGRVRPLLDGVKSVDQLSQITVPASRCTLTPLSTASQTSNTLQLQR